MILRSLLTFLVLVMGFSAPALAVPGFVGESQIVVEEGYGFRQDQPATGASEGTTNSNSESGESGEDQAEGFWTSYSGLLITFGPLILGLAGIGLLVLFRKISEAREKKKKQAK